MEELLSLDIALSPYLIAAWVSVKIRTTILTDMWNLDSTSHHVTSSSLAEGYQAKRKSLSHFKTRRKKAELVMKSPSDIKKVTNFDVESSKYKGPCKVERTSFGESKILFCSLMVNGHRCNFEPGSSYRYPEDMTAGDYRGATSIMDQIWGHILRQLHPSYINHWPVILRIMRTVKLPHCYIILPAWQDKASF